MNSRVQFIFSILICAIFHSETVLAQELDKAALGRVPAGRKADAIRLSAKLVSAASLLDDLTSLVVAKVGSDKVRYGYKVLTEADRLYDEQKIPKETYEALENLAFYLITDGSKKITASGPNSKEMDQYFESKKKSIVRDIPEGAILLLGKNCFSYSQGKWTKF